MSSKEWLPAGDIFSLPAFCKAARKLISDAVIKYVWIERSDIVSDYF